LADLEGHLASCRFLQRLVLGTKPLDLRFQIFVGCHVITDSTETACPPTTANPRNANLVLMEAVAFNRSDFVLRGKRLEYFTIGYNTVEGLISLVAGFVAGSI